MWGCDVVCIMDWFMEEGAYPYLHPSNPTRRGVFVFLGVVTVRLLQLPFYIPFLPDPPGIGPTSPTPCPSLRESDRCWRQQMVGMSVVKWHHAQTPLQLALDGRIDSHQTSCSCWPWEVRNRVENPMSTSLPSPSMLWGNWIWIKGIRVFNKGQEGCLVFSNNRNASGVDLRCPFFLPSSPARSPCFEGLKWSQPLNLMATEWKTV